MYGWYRIGVPVNASFDVYNDTHSQDYELGSGQSASAQEYTDPAIAAVRSVGMETTDGQLFLPMYWDGECEVNSSGGAYLRSSPSTSSSGTLLANGKTPFNLFKVPVQCNPLKAKI